MAERRTRIVVVGAGISGLAFAFALSSRHDVVVLEGSARAGGNLRTTKKDGFLIDHAGDSWVAAKPAATELARALGLGDRLIETLPQNRRVYVAQRDGSLVPLPEGLLLGLPTRVRPLLRTPLLTWRGKLRALIEPLLPVGFGRDPSTGDDEALDAWITRRFGHEVEEELAGPLLGGLYTGDVSNLSMRAVVPQLAALEKRGGVFLAGRKMSPKVKAGAVRGSPFTGLAGGIGELIDALTARLGDRIRYGARVLRVSRRDGGGYEVGIDGSEPIHAEHVVVTGPAHAAANLVRPHSDALADELASIVYGSASTVFLAYPRTAIAHPLDATGYIVPARERPTPTTALASTWVTSKWAGRAPPGMVLLRFFFGSAAMEGDDASLVALGRAEAKRVLHVDAAPSLDLVARYVRASPQPRVGHPAKMARVRELLRGLPGLHLLGSAYDGVGISDCVRQANQLAAGLG